MHAKCQLAAVSEEVARELTATEKLMLRWGKIQRRLVLVIPKLFSPAAVIRKARIAMGRSSAGGPLAAAVAQVPGEVRPIKCPPLVLQPNELIRVKSMEDIEKTLDAKRCCEGCAFMANMHEYCGKSFRVRKRIELFFDERNRKLLKAKNMVILESVHCHSEPDAAYDWAGCDRNCYLFWKESWLERVES